MPILSRGGLVGSWNNRAPAVEGARVPLWEGAGMPASLGFVSLSWALPLPLGPAA